MNLDTTNRALTNRPTSTLQTSAAPPLRQVSLKALPKAHPCRLTGHNHLFLNKDRYGCCTRCGDEVLT